MVAIRGHQHDQLWLTLAACQQHARGIIGMAGNQHLLFLSVCLHFLVPVTKFGQDERPNYLIVADEA